MMEERTSDAFKVDHVPWALVDMLNQFQYVPAVIIISVGGSEFGVTSGSKTRAKFQQMIFACRDLLRLAQPFQQNGVKLFFHLLHDQPDFLGWDSQAAARKARANLNNIIGKYATAAGQAVIPHSNIKKHDPLLFVQPTDDLSLKGLHIVVQNTVKALKKCQPHLFVKR